MQARLRAFIIHLSSSALVLGLFALIVLFWWYPGPMLSLQGGWEILLLVLIVDLILGPSLTGLIYKQGKKGLIFDLSVIVLLQIAALSYGVSSIHAQRPNYLAFVFDRFYVVPVGDTVGKLPADVVFPSWRGSVLLATAPTTPQTTTQTLDELAALSEVNIVPMLALMAADARPFPDGNNFSQSSKGKRIAEIKNEDVREHAFARTLELGHTPDEVRTFQVVGRQRSATALVRVQDGQLLDIVK